MVLIGRMIVMIGMRATMSTAYMSTRIPVIDIRCRKMARFCIVRQKHTSYKSERSKKKSFFNSFSIFLTEVAAE